MVRRQSYFNEISNTLEGDTSISTKEVVMYSGLEVATPLPAPFQAAAAMLLPGEVTATAWLPTFDVIYARQWS